MNQGNLEFGAEPPEGRRAHGFGASRETTFFPIDDMPLLDVTAARGPTSRRSSSRTSRTAPCRESIDMSPSSTASSRASSTADQIAFQHYANVEEDDIESSLDNPNDMIWPPTREPSPDPVWAGVWHSAKTYEWNQQYLAERIQSHGQYLAPEPSVKSFPNNASDCGGGGLSLVSLWADESVARASQALGADWDASHMSSREPPLQRRDVIPVQHHQTMLVVPSPGIVLEQDANAKFPMSYGAVMPSSLQSMPTPSADHVPSGIPSLGKEPSATLPNPLPSSGMPPAPQQNLSPAPKQKSLTRGAQSKQSGKATGSGQVKGDDVLDKLSADQKEALCKYIFNVMVEKGFTSHDGYLLEDFFSEVWKEMGIGNLSSGSGRVAQKRFGYLLRSAPQYFRFFRKIFRASPIRMVRLVLEK